MARPGPLRARSAKAHNEDVRNQTVPKPRHVKGLRVIEMALRRVSQRHARFHRAVKAERANSAIINYSDVVVWRNCLENDVAGRRSSRRNDELSNQQQDDASLHVFVSLRMGSGWANHRSMNTHATPRKKVK